ncbi:MAG: hypothetical protein M3220_10755 [Chloroflexota bacterium]|nr:hypothetical protein [Chloroflexota bacterium]
MIRLSPGDLIAVESGGRFYYAVILSPVALFGGHWAYVFHRSSSDLLSSETLLSGDTSGYHAYVDFIWAKRENRITRIAKKVDVQPFSSVDRLKSTHATQGKAHLWFLYDLEHQELGRVEHLTQEQKRFPLRERIDDTIMVERVEQRWTPEQDPRI